MRKLLFIIIYLSFISPAFAGGNKAIENALHEYIKGKDARI
ncbi:class A beta-lactamase, partial [Muribaculaceae bacterium Isolate-080 (Janvier)]